MTVALPGSAHRDVHSRWTRLIAGLLAVFLIVPTTWFGLRRLSAVANLLAGLSRYQFGKYLVLTLVGRALWTSAYLGLGYAVGTDLEAASAFLTNLSAFLLCAVALVASASIAIGQFEASSRLSSVVR